MVALGLYSIALTFVGMAAEIMHLANSPSGLDLRLRAGGIPLETDDRELAKLRLRRVAARLSGVVLLIAGFGMAAMATKSWL